MKNVSKKSGVGYKVNLDAATLSNVQEIKDFHQNELGAVVSLSVIVRRAIKLYSRFLCNLVSTEDKETEALVLLKTR